jgi:hypothetical protein
MAFLRESSPGRFDVIVDAHDRIVGLEVLGASRLFDPGLLSEAAREKP